MDRSGEGVVREGSRNVSSERVVGEAEVVVVVRGTDFRNRTSELVVVSLDDKVAVDHGRESS